MPIEDPSESEVRLHVEVEMQLCRSVGVVVDNFGLL